MVSFTLGVRGRRLLAAGLAALALLVVAWRHVAASARAPAPLRVAPIAPRRAAPHSGGVAGLGGLGGPAGRTLVVDVVGAVRRPGLVRLQPGARVVDAVAQAGGLGRKAERSAVNLAAPVSDGQQVVVPRRRAAPPSGAAAGAAPGGTGPSGAAVPAAPVSLSTASPEELDALPGVGPVTAQKIVAFRQAHGAFRSVDELDAIPGIGPSRIADLRGLVVP
jgi:competence protein ComEA